MASQAIVDRELTLADFDYELPPALIAQHPLEDRSASRLLHVAADGLHDRRFADLEHLLRPGDLMVFNDTQVIPARLIGAKPSGGRVEVLIERVIEPHAALALVRTSHTPRSGAVFVFGDVTATVESRCGDLFGLRFDAPVDTVLARHGLVPLPPYIGHRPDATDRARYQTVYALRPGAVAAPTAGLHFTRELLERLQQRRIEFAWLTLHVGAGTFQPVRVERLAEHRMHSERFEIDGAAARSVNRARAEGRRVVAVGTTTLRALEAASSVHGTVDAGVGETDLFITPGYCFRAVDALVTNFHLPRSTLLMLVSAFAGIERVRSAYAHAVAQRYRFYSYGDAMLFERSP